MGAGVPNYQQLHQWGKLPKEARKFVPGLADTDIANEELESVKKENLWLRAVLKKHGIDLRKEREIKEAILVQEPNEEDKE